MTGGDILVLAVLGLIVGAIIGSMVRNKKKGKHSCCGSCTGCSLAGTGCQGCKGKTNG